MQSILDLQSLDFRIAYCHYQNENSLEESHRTKVAKALIYAFIEKDPEKSKVKFKNYDTQIQSCSFRLNKTDFQHLAKMITLIFPTKSPPVETIRLSNRPRSTSRTINVAVIIL